MMVSSGSTLRKPRRCALGLLRMPRTLRQRGSPVREGTDLAGQAEGLGRGRARSRHPGTHRRDRQDHLDRDLRVGSAPLRAVRSVPRCGRHPRPRADGRRRGGRQRRSRVWRSATGSSSRSTSRAGTASCAGAGCSPSARRRRCASTAAARRCSDTPSSTARCPAARRSSCAFRSPTTTTSRSAPTCRTTGTSSSATSCRPPGRASSTRTSRMAGTSS